MTKTIIAENISEGFMQAIRIKTELEINDLTAAIRAAVKDFLDSPESDTAKSVTNGDFNWGDMVLWLPEKFQKEHGFEVLSADLADRVVSHDASLIPRENI